MYVVICSDTISVQWLGRAAPCWAYKSTGSEEWSHQEAQCHGAHRGQDRPELRFSDSSSQPAPSCWSGSAPHMYQLLFSLDCKPSEGTDRLFLENQCPHYSWHGRWGGAVSENTGAFASETASGLRSVGFCSPQAHRSLPRLLYRSFVTVVS